MQKSQIDIKLKTKILVISTAIVLLVMIPFSAKLSLSYALHIGIHILAIILATFLSVIAFLTFRDFRTSRLFLVMCAFVTMALTEITALSMFFILPTPNPTTDSLITHGLILVMLSFFAVGIFRRD